MEKLSTVTYGVISLVVVVLLIFTIAIPVIEDAQTEQRTIENNGTALYSLNSASTVTLDTVVVEETTITAINGVGIDEIVEDETIQRIYVMWDHGCAYSSYNADTGIWGSIWSLRHYDEGSLVTASSSLVTFENGAVSYTDTSEVEHTSSYTFIMMPDAKGTYGAYSISNVDYAKPIYVDSKSVIYISQMQSDILLTAKGTVDSIAPAVAYKSQDRTSDTTITIKHTPTEHDASNAVYSMTDNLPYSANQYVNIQIFVPIEYTVITDNQNMIAVLLSVIPLVLAIVPIMLAVNMITTRRD